jgi:membrane-associated phospholipid phosphatase
LKPLHPVRVGSGRTPEVDAFTRRAMFVAVPLLVFVALAALVTADPKPDLDERLLMFLSGYAEGSVLGDALEFLAVACFWAGALIFFAVLGALSIRRRFASAVFLGSVIVGSIVLERALKHVIERAAINHEQTYSFPSGSATVSLAVVVALALLSGYRRRVWAFAAGAAVVVVYGLSIVSLGWHYPTDVVAGWCVAVALATALWFALGRPTVEAPLAGAS